jgi:hypothetical protein
LFFFFQPDQSNDSVQVVNANISILELDALATRCIDHTTTVRALLLLVLLFGKALALGHNQVGVSAVSIIVGDICVAGEFRINLCVRLDALESVFDVVLLRFDRSFC